MRQKLAFAMAVIHQPVLLVLDEPTTGVDPVSRAVLWRLIAGAAAGGAGILFSTTYLDEAERADSVLVLDAGRTLLNDTPERIIATVPGGLYELAGDVPPEMHARSWRRGRMRHVWAPAGVPPAGAVALRPDLADAAIVAALAAREQEGAA
jgi:ABC-2 type transport system ATP-binding protein